MKAYSFKSKASGNYFMVVKNTPETRAILKRVNKALRDSNMKVVPYGRGPVSARLKGRYFGYTLNAPLNRAPLMALYLQGTDNTLNWRGVTIWTMVRRSNQPSGIVAGIRSMFRPETVVMVQ